MKQLRTPVYFLLVYVIISFYSCAKGDSSSQKDDPVDSSEPDNISRKDHSIGVANTKANEKLAEKFNTLLVFHADDTMQINKAYIATLALAKNSNLKELKAKVLDASDASDDKTITDTNIQIGKRMKARLIDMSPRKEPSFYIEAMGEEEQNLNTSKEAFWNWKIEPLKEGQQQLKLSVQVIKSDDDKINLPPRDIMVTIFSQKVSVAAKIGNFFSNYWQWIITGILLPLIIAWLTTKIKQGSSNKK